MADERKRSFHILLPDGDGHSIWMVPADNGWALPSLSCEGDWWLNQADRIVPFIREHLPLDLDFTLLRYASVTVDENDRWQEIVWVLECHQPLASPPLPGRWIDLTDLAVLPLAVPAQHLIISSYLQEQADGYVPERRAPWARPGWYAAAVRWIETALVDLGYRQTGSVQQMRTWGISCILRAPTERGFVYFKAVADLPLWSNEPVLMATLAEHFPASVPRPLRIDADHRWMLLADFGEALEKQPVLVVEAVFRQLGQMQLVSVAMVDALLSLGCPDRRLPRMHAQIDELIAHPLAQATLPPDQLVQLQRLAPRLKAMCDDLAQFPIPHTLVHGDLHLGNVAQDPDGYLFYDWTDACIAHPFLDVMEPYFLRKDETALAQLRDIYLATWTVYAPMAELQAAWALSRPLHALFQAVSYLHISAGLEPHVQPEMLDGLREFLGVVLNLVNLPPHAAVT